MIVPSRKERVLRAIGHRPADRVPRGELCIEDATIEDFLGIAGPLFHHRRQFVDRLEMDLVCLSPQYPDPATAPPLPLPENVVWPDLARWARETDLFPFVVVEGPFAWGMRRWGFEEFLLKVARADPRVARFNAAIEAFNHTLGRRAAAQGAAGVVLADDIAYGSGPIFSPEQLRTAFFPSLGRQVKNFQASGLYVFFHSDGRLDPVVEDIAAAGFDGLQCIEEAAGMDLGRIKSEFGRRLCLWGNLDPAYLTGPLKEGVLESKVREILATGGAEGGFIFGTSSGLFRGIRPDLLGRAYAWAP